VALLADAYSDHANDWQCHMHCADRYSQSLWTYDSGLNTMTSFGHSNLANTRALILLMPSDERISLAMSFMALNGRSHSAVLTTRHSHSDEAVLSCPELSLMNCRRRHWIHQHPFFHRVWIIVTDLWLPDLMRQWSCQHSTYYCIASIRTEFCVRFHFTHE